MAETPVTPLTGEDLYAGGRRLLKPTADPSQINRGTDVPFPEDVDVKDASPKGERASDWRGPPHAGHSIPR